MTFTLRSWAVCIAIGVSIGPAAMAGEANIAGRYACALTGVFKIPGPMLILNADGTYATDRNVQTGTWSRLGGSIAFTGGLMASHTIALLPKHGLRLSRKVFCSRIAMPEPAEAVKPPVTVTPVYAPEQAPQSVKPKLTKVPKHRKT